MQGARVRGNHACFTCWCEVACRGWKLSTQFQQRISGTSSTSPFRSTGSESSLMAAASTVPMLTRSTVPSRPRSAASAYSKRRAGGSAASDGRLSPTPMRSSGRSARSSVASKPRVSVVAPDKLQRGVRGPVSRVRGPRSEVRGRIRHAPRDEAWARFVHRILPHRLDTPAGVRPCTICRTRNHNPPNCRPIASK